MRQKFRNIPRNAFMRNFSTYIIDRYIIIDNDGMNDNQQDDFVKKLNERLWYAIQETNAIAQGQILPFIRVRRVVRDQTKLRIIINDLDSTNNLQSYSEEQEIDIQTADISHLINFKVVSPHRRIMVSDNLITGDAKMIIDEKDQIAAAVDIFLDIAMFNSISFFRDMSVTEKKNFNLKKYSFYNSHNFESYYKVDRTKPPAYFSFAFSARTDSDHIDYDRYLYIWHEFIENSEFKDMVNVNVPPEKQLQQHKDKENLKREYFESDFWKKIPEGDYLLLRVNELPNNNNRKNMIKNYFGMESFHVGYTKIVPISEYFKPFVQRQLKELLISAFKIVV